jgi:type I restriction enzyme S subunit
MSELSGEQGVVGAAPHADDEGDRFARWGIPSFWKWRAVADIGPVDLGRQRSPKDHAGPQMRPYVRAANITWGGWSLDGIKEMNFDDEEFAHFHLRDGDVLINEGSGSAKEVGKPAIWRGQVQNCCFQNTLLRVRPTGTSSEYLYLYFLFCALTGRFVSSTQGVNIFHIGKLGLAKFPVPVPPLAEQRRIVAKLDSLSGKSKRARDHLDHIPILVQKYKRALLAAAHNAAQQNSINAATLGEISVEVRNGLSKKPSEDSSGTPILRISAVRALNVQLPDVRYYPASEKMPDSAFLREGDLLFTRYNGNPDFTAVCGMVRGLTRPTTYPDKLIRVRLDQMASPRFVELMCCAPQSRDWLAPRIKSAAGQHGISGGDLKELPLPLPSLSDQRECVRRIEHAFTWIDRLAIEATSARKLVDHLDQAVLAKAFRGELVPQDPDDEPASVLLDRIKAERATGVASDEKRKGRTATQ